jgi:uncharacterized protein (TIGR02246 family)
MYSLESPEDLHQAMAKAYNARNLEALTNLYVDDGILIPSPETYAQGKKLIKEALTQFLKIGGTMDVSTVFVYRVGDIAHTRASWKILDNGKILAQASGSETMQRNSNGDWLFVVDHPFGAEK